MHTYIHPKTLLRYSWWVHSFLAYLKAQRGGKKRKGVWALGYLPFHKTNKEFLRLGHMYTARLRNELEQVRGADLKCQPAIQYQVFCSCRVPHKEHQHSVWYYT